MATTRIISMHINKGKTIAQCLTDRTDYAENPDKTNDGEFISAYECDHHTANSEFLLAKRQYLAITGREQKSDVIAYQIRQAFKPGEITPKLANKIGYELGLKFTKGNHAFIVATHIDKSHIHNHIIYNSTSLDCTKKFRDFLGSGKAVRNISDRLCLEYGMSVIENPKRGKTGYGKWLNAIGNCNVTGKSLSLSEKLQTSIDTILTKKPADFDAFLLEMQAAGYEIKQGKYLAFKSKEQKKFIRLRSLGEGYSEDAIRTVIAGGKVHTPQKRTAVKEKPRVSLLVDIQAKLQAGKSGGYERWAKVFNLKQMAQTMSYLTENNLLDYVELTQKAQTVTERFNLLSSQIKTAEKRMAEIAVLKTRIVNYSKTRDVYTEYRKAGYSKKFCDEHTSELLLHKAAKAAFNKLTDKKLPTIKMLQTEYAELLTAKKKAYSEYTSVKKDMREVVTAKANVDRLFGSDIAHTEKTKEAQTVK